MDLEFTWINLLILFGAFQGLIFGIILLANKQHSGSKFLAFFILILSYNGIETFGWSSGLDEHTMIFNVLSFVLIFGLGPSLYLYSYSLMKPASRLTMQKLVVAYSPLLFQFLMKAVLLSLFIYELEARYKVDFLMDPRTTYHFFYRYSEPASVIVFWIFLGLSIRVFQNFKKENTVSFIPKPIKHILIKWMNSLFISMVILALLWLITLIAPVLFDIQYDVHYYPIELLLVLFIYWIAFVGYHKIKLIYPKIANRITNGMSSVEVNKHLSMLHQAMERDKLYLDSGLNRERMAEHVGINAKKLSSVLNQYANQSFNDFVNSYRVQEVKDRLKARKDSHLTISAIALDAGFNSQATFQRVFKSIEGVSPKEFLNRTIKKIRN
ncbi:MAG: helix-turn-helix domain-containing protein [Bacteroidota bacterium]